MSLLLLQRCTSIPYQYARQYRRRILLERSSLMVVPPYATAGGALTRRGLLCNAAVNGDSVTQSAVSECLERVVGPAAPSRCDFAVMFYEGHEGAQVQKALDTFVKRYPQAPPIFGCSLGEGWKRYQHQQQQHPQSQRPAWYSSDATAESPASTDASSKIDAGEIGAVKAATGEAVDADAGEGEELRGKSGLPVNPSISLESSDEDDDSDSNTNSDTESSDDGSAASVSSDDYYKEGDDGSVVMGDGNISIAGAGLGRAEHDRSEHKRSDEQLSDEDDDAFSSEAMGELFGSVDTVLEALHGGPVPGATSSKRGGMQAVSRRKARRLRRQEEAKRRLYEKQGLAPRIVTVLGLGFEGRAAAIPALANYGAFPYLGGGGESVRKVFSLAEGQRAHFLLLCRKSAAFGLERSLERIANLLPGGTRLAAVSSGGQSSVVSSFPAGESPVVGICLHGDVSVKEQAELACKTLGAFGVGGVRVAGNAADELFVPSTQSAPSQTPDHHRQQQEQERQHEKEEQTPPVATPPTSSGSLSSQLCVFKVDDFVFPGMRRRYNIFEPRYRALVKRCLRDREPLLLLPQSAEGNAVGTVAWVTGLYNVLEDGRCEIEITGLARCSVNNMWMRGESFGLYEATVDYFEDDERAETSEKQQQHQRRQRQEKQKQQDTDSSAVAATSAVDPGVDEDGKVEKEDSSSALNMEQLKILVSAVLHRELFRTQQTGFSRLWPGLKSEDVPGIMDYGEGSRDVGGGGNATLDGVVGGIVEGAEGEAGGGLVRDLGRLDAEALSFWAAQHVSANAEIKLRWLSCRSTEERLVDITNHLRLADKEMTAMTRHGGNDVLSRIFRAIKVKPDSDGKKG